MITQRTLTSLLGAWVLLATTLRAQEPAAPIAHLIATPPAQRTAAAAQLWSALRARGTPIVESMVPDSVVVTFVHRARPDSVRSVIVRGGVANLGLTSNAMTNVTGTDVWYGVYRVPARARFLYQFVENDSGRATRDTLNPKTAPYLPGNVASVFEGPTAVSLDWSRPRDGIARGALTTQTLASARLGKTRALSVYLPAGFDARSAHDLPLVVLFDAAPYLSADYVPTPTILDNLIVEHRIPPTIVVLVDTPQPSRLQDLWLSSDFADFIALELIPWVRQTYHASTDARRTVIAGSSLGGLTATFVAMRHPEIAGRVISQSGSYWAGQRAGRDTAPEWIRRTLADSPAAPITFWMEVGDYESAAANPVGMEATNRRLRDLLVAKGYAVRYQEFAGAHEYVNWRASLPAALEYSLRER